MVAQRVRVSSFEKRSRDISRVATVEHVCRLACLFSCVLNCTQITNCMYTLVHEGTTDSSRTCDFDREYVSSTLVIACVKSEGFPCRIYRYPVAASFEGVENNVLSREPRTSWLLSTSHRVSFLTVPFNHTFCFYNI